MSLWVSGLQIGISPDVELPIGPYVDGPSGCYLFLTLNDILRIICSCFGFVIVNKYSVNRRREEKYFKKYQKGSLYTPSQRMQIYDGNFLHCPHIINISCRTSG